MTKYSCIVVLAFLILGCPIENNNNDSYGQVYEEWGEKAYVGSDTLVGEPYIPSVVNDRGVAEMPLPGSTSAPNSMPWTIHGSIKSGILSIDFPETLHLSDEYASARTGGVKIARVHIKKKNNLNYHLALHKRNEQNSGVILYYLDKDFNGKDSNGAEIILKAGWNFWDEQNNIISQNINDFLHKGYRWRWELWV